MSITASLLLKIQLKAEQMWADSQLAQEYKTNADAAVAVLRNQTARFAELTQKDKDRTVTVMWMDPCGVEVEDCESDCDITGALPDTDSEDYALDLCKSASFSINMETLRTNQYGLEELAARSLMLRIKALDEWWAQQILIKLKAFAGINVFPNTYVYADGTTNIPAAQYNEQLWAYLQQASIINKMPASYLIDNGSLFMPFANAGIDGRNSEGAGAAARAALLSGRLTYDMFNFIPAGLTEDTFAVAPGAVAFKTKTRFSATPVYLDGSVNQWRYTVKSNTLPGVEYDVISALSCVENNDTDQEEIVQTWKLKTRGGIFLNPNGCPITIGEDTFTPTGVLSFSKDAPIVEA